MIDRAVGVSDLLSLPASWGRVREDGIVTSRHLGSRGW